MSRERVQSHIAEWHIVVSLIVEQEHHDVTVTPPKLHGDVVLARGIARHRECQNLCSRRITAPGPDRQTISLPIRTDPGGGNRRRIGPVHEIMRRLRNNVSEINAIKGVTVSSKSCPGCNRPDQQHAEQQNLSFKKDTTTLLPDLSGGHDLLILSTVLRGVKTGIPFA